MIVTSILSNPISISKYSEIFSFIAAHFCFVCAFNNDPMEASPGVHKPLTGSILINVILIILLYIGPKANTLKYTDTDTHTPHTHNICSGSLSGHISLLYVCSSHVPRAHTLIFHATTHSHSISHLTINSVPRYDMPNNLSSYLPHHTKPL